MNKKLLYMIAAALTVCVICGSVPTAAAAGPLFESYDTLLEFTDDTTLEYSFSFYAPGKEIEVELALYQGLTQIITKTFSGKDTVSYKDVCPANDRAVYYLIIDASFNGEPVSLTDTNSLNQDALWKSMPILKPLHKSTTQGGIWVGGFYHEYLGILTADAKVAQFEVYCNDRPPISAHSIVTTVSHYDGLYYTNTGTSSGYLGCASAGTVFDSVYVDPSANNGIGIIYGADPWYAIGTCEIAVVGGKYEKFDTIVARTVIDFRNDYDKFSEPLR